jgi:hypothetical protein
MKIGIISYHNSVNYGAVLQIFALKTTLEKMGAEVSVIDYRAIASEYGEFSLRKSIENNSFIKALAKFLYYNLIAKKSIKDRKEKFDDFTIRYFNFSPHYKSLNEFEKLNKYDAIICGSDQIWNPEITNGFDPMLFCDFNSDRVRKYSYAASVGDVMIISTEDKKTVFLNLIKNFEQVSVREQDLADFISENTEINPLVTLDPTLLLNAKEYDKVEDTKNTKKDYVLIYQLSRYPKTLEVAKQLAKENNLQIIEIINNPYIRNKNKLMQFSASPAEFVNLMKNANYIITNSFHGTVFSIIFRKNFYTIVSRVRNSRIINILGTLGLSDRLLEESSRDFPRDEIDYSKVKPLLEKEREASLNYLKKIILGGKHE